MINPLHRHHYQSEAWLEAAAFVRARSRGRCEACGVANADRGCRTISGEWISACGSAGDITRSYNLPLEIAVARALGIPARLIAQRVRHRSTLIRIILTVAHLDHDGHLGHHDPQRLAHLCQRCHLALDREERRCRRLLNSARPAGGNPPASSGVAETST